MPVSHIDILRRCRPDRLLMMEGGAVDAEDGNKESLILTVCADLSVWVFGSEEYRELCVPGS